MKILKWIKRFFGIIFILAGLSGLSQFKQHPIGILFLFLVGFLLIYNFKKNKEVKEEKGEKKKTDYYCNYCGKKINLSYWSVITKGTRDNKGKFVYYCDKCVEERKRIESILTNLGFFGGGNKDYFLVGKNNMDIELSLDEIYKKLNGKPITEDVIEEIVDIEIEKSKIKEREKRAKLKERAEKEYYGKVKTKRESFDNDAKEAVYSKYDNACAVCGGIEGLHIHHKDKNSKNNKISNLILLCGVCHKKVHMKVR